MTIRVAGPSDVQFYRLRYTLQTDFTRIYEKVRYIALLFGEHTVGYCFV